MRRVAVLLCLVGGALLIPSEEIFAPEGVRSQDGARRLVNEGFGGEFATMSPALLEHFPPVLWPLPRCPIVQVTTISVPVIVCRIGIGLVTAVVGWKFGRVFYRLVYCMIERTCLSAQGNASVLEGVWDGAVRCWTLVVCAAALVVPPAVCKNPHEVSFYFLDRGQLQKCINVMAPPRHLLPVHAGADLVAEEMKYRQWYFVCLLLWLLFLAFAAGNILTWVRRTFTCIGYGTSPAGPSFSSLSRESKVDLLDRGPIAVTTHVPLFLHLALHFFCASLSLLAAATSRLDAKSGVCWEIYVYWMVVMLGCSFLHATYCAWQTPGDLLPNLAIPVVKPVLPLVGEALDTFRDWLFVGIALSQRTWMSAAFAAIGVAILAFSGSYLRTHHSAELVELLLPVQYACESQQHAQGDSKTTREMLKAFLWKIACRQTSFATLSIVLTEDLPQAVFQSLFVLLYGGSWTQFVFIGLSVTKILICLTFRAVVLAREGRIAESFEAELLFYRYVVLLFGYILKENAYIALYAKLQLAVATFNCCNGGLEDIEQQVQDLVVRFQDSCSEKHPVTLDARRFLAQIMCRRGRFREAEEVQREVVDTVMEPELPAVFKLILSGNHQMFLVHILFKVDKNNEARDLCEKVVKSLSCTCNSPDCFLKNELFLPTKLDAELGLAKALRKLGENSEAIRMQKEVLEVSKAELGEMALLTLLAQSELARSLFDAGDFSEAEKLQLEVIELSRRAFGRKSLVVQSELTLSAQHNLAEILSALGQTDKAVELLQEVLELRQQVLDAEHPDILTTREALAKLEGDKE